jgi:protein O-mannosyl-transferase
MAKPKIQNKNIGLEQLMSPNFISKYWIISVLLITFLCFSNTLFNGFTNWDDEHNFLNNEFVVNFTKQSFLTNTKNIFTSEVIGNYNPLSIFSLAIDKLIYGFENPFGFHLTNLLMHLLCVFLVYQLVIALKFDNKVALITSLLFGIHPMRVESVAWITERKDVLFAIFYFWGMLLYIKNYGQMTLKKNFTILLIFILSCFSKIQAVIFPLSLMMVDYFMNGGIKWKDILSKIHFFLISLAFGIFGITALQRQGSIESAMEVDYATYVKPFIGSFSLLVYLIKSIIPYELCPLYPYPPDPSWMWFASAAIILSILFFIYKSIKNGNRIIVFGFGFFFVNVMMLLQVLGAGQGFIADRFTYVPYFGLFLIYAYYTTQFISKTNKPYLKYGTVAIFLIFGVMTFAQNRVWKNSETLWTKVLSHYDQITTPYGNRANYRRDIGNISGAIEDYESAIKLTPIAQTFNSRAKLFFDHSNNLDTLRMAIADYEKAIELDSLNGEFYSNKGATYARIGMIQKAIEDLTISIRLSPEYATSYLNRSVLYSRTEQYQKAINDIEMYLKLKPYHADIWFEGGRMQAILGNWEASLAMINNAIKYDKSKGVFYYQKGLVYYNTDRLAEAIKEIKTAINLGYNQVDPAVKQKLGL